MVQQPGDSRRLSVDFFALHVAVVAVQRVCVEVGGACLECVEVPELLCAVQMPAWVT